MENNRNQGVQIIGEKKHGMRRRILIISLAVCVMAVLATGTVAFFTADETAYNAITTGELSMDLVEETTDGEPWPEEGISGVMPGTAVDKIAYVVNDGNVDFYARAEISMKMTDPDGKELSTQYISLDINTKDWTEKDGFYYYNYIVKPGEQTKPLFTTVTFDTAMDNPYMNARVEIDIHAQAVQSKNNGTSALDAIGWSDAY